MHIPSTFAGNASFVRAERRSKLEEIIHIVHIYLASYVSLSLVPSFSISSSHAHLNLLPHHILQIHELDSGFSPSKKRRVLPTINNNTVLAI
jgi:hypothetical protein